MFGDSRAEAFAFVIFEKFLLFLPTYYYPPHSPTEIKFFKDTHF
jgi:hypothetical protein